MIRCEPVGIFACFAIAFVCGYFLVRAIRAGEIFSGFPYFPKEGGYSFFVTRKDNPITFWGQCFIYSVIVFLIAYMAFPSTLACVAR